VAVKPNVDLNLLRCFAALLAQHSVSRAARQVGIAQPSMSYALNKLRLLFDDPLFLNAHGVMSPTSKARALEPEVNELLARADMLLSRAAPFDPEAATIDFNIMAAEYAEYELLGPLIRRLAAEAPGVRLLFQSADRDRAFEKLERGDLDFRLAWWTLPAATLRSKSLFNDTFLCLARTGHPALRGKSITEAAFLDLPQVVIQPLRSGLTYQALVNAFTRRERTLTIALQVQNAISLCSAVGQTDSIAILPARFARHMADMFSLQAVPVPFSVGIARQSIYWHERTHRLPSHQWFRSLVADVAAGI
jgi:DNA-binding transcriptional LysR family regulator